MAKAKTAYFCQECGYNSPKWVGRCPSCGEWNTMVQEVIEKEDKKAAHLYTDDTELLEWNSNIRATISFVDLNDFLSKRNLFKKGVKRWIEETKEF